MENAGYSGTPLPQKLGIKPDSKLLLLHVPPDYFDLVGKSVKSQIAEKNGIPDLVHLFSVSAKEMESDIQALLPLFEKNPKLICWVSWYKKSAKIPTDITEDVIRDYAIKNGLVDVKVCAVSEIWSGLKLVKRKQQ